MWTLPSYFSDASVIFGSLFVIRHRPHHRTSSCFPHNAALFYFLSCFSKAAIPRLTLPTSLSQKAAKHELDLLPCNTTFSTALTPVTGAIKLDLLTPSSCITPDIDLLPPWSCTLNRVPTLPLLAFCRNTKRYSFFTSPSVPYNLKHVFACLRMMGASFSEVDLQRCLAGVTLILKASPRCTVDD